MLRMIGGARHRELTLHSDPVHGYKYYACKAAVYHSPKSALNMCTINLACELRDTLFEVPWPRTVSPPVSTATAAPAPCRKPAPGS
jgi:NAD(P)-dependent dehydrogenase (short-subunit alcohol dehydrogenase family)